MDTLWLRADVELCGNTAVTIAQDVLVVVEVVEADIELSVSIAVESVSIVAVLVEVQEAVEVSIALFIVVTRDYMLVVSVGIV